PPRRRRSPLSSSSTANVACWSAISPPSISVFSTGSRCACARRKRPGCKTERKTTFRQQAPNQRRPRAKPDGTERGMGYSTSIRGKRQRIVTALDIGTSKICCLIAKAQPSPDWLEGRGDAMQFEVIGFDHTRAEGLKAGMIAHLDSAEACIRSAVDAAERMAGVTVEDVHVSVTCGRLKSETFAASLAL